MLPLLLDEAIGDSSGVPAASISQLAVELQAIFRELGTLCWRNGLRPCAVERRHCLPADPALVHMPSGNFYEHTVRLVVVVVVSGLLCCWCTKGVLQEGGSPRCRLV